jgi:hypothetical protein
MMTAKDRQLQENIEALGRVFKEQPSVARDVMASIHSRKGTPKVPSRLSGVWRLIMNKRFRQIAIAATILIFVGVTVWWVGGSIDGTNRAYAMSEMPDLFRSARTLHMKARVYYPKRDGSGELFSVEAENWLDLENQRWRSAKPSMSLNEKQEMQISIGEEIYAGGDYALSLDRQNKQASYQRVTPFRRAYKVREAVTLLLQFSFGDPKLFDQYQLVGQEQIDGEQYDIWQVDMNEGGVVARLRSWLSPKTGRLLKSEVSFKKSEKGQWITQGEVYLIERDVPIDDKVFLQTVPQEYSTETIDTTLHSCSLQSSGSLELSVYLLMQLDDGSVIACWKSKDQESETNPARLLDGIKPGDEFPEFPVVVNGLSTQNSYNKSTHHGYYVAHTVHDSEIYLWGLYVPLEKEDPEILNGYTICHRSYVIGENFEGRLQTNASMTIENQRDFETFVLGAMADFSDANAELPDLTYEGTLKLAEQIRRAMK